MKICEKCHCENADTRVFCVDCGATLGEKLSEEQEAAHRKNLSDNFEKMYNRTDPLYVSVFDKVVGVLALLGCVASVVLPFFKPHTVTGDHPYLWAFLFFAGAAVDAFFPHLNWELEKLRMGIWANGADNLEPNRFYLVGRRSGLAVIVAVGILLLILSVLSAQEVP